MLQQRYMIVGQAGRGGMGAVYEARDVRLGQKRVAIKEMSQAHLNREELVIATVRFQQEAHLLGSLQHPNLPHIFDAFSERGRSYLVMDFIDGKTLHQVLRAQPGQTLPIAQVIQYACQLCNVLSYLHQQRPPIIFRDVKPSNVMITEEGQVYLIDFGIARFFTEGKEQDTVQLGSPGYAPPEQHGSAQTNPRSDIYGLGATLHYCLSGRDPYYATEHFTFVPLRQINPQVPIELERLIQRMVAPDESQRPGSANDVLQALQGLSNQASAHTIAIQQNSDASAPTLYQMPQGTPAQLQATIQPGLMPPTHPWQQQTIAAGMQQQATRGPGLWTASFTLLFFLVLLLSVGGSIAVMALLYPHPDGWAWLLEAGLAGIGSLVALVASVQVRTFGARILLLLPCLMSIVAGLAALAMGSLDVQHHYLPQGITPALLPFIAIAGQALAALCTLAWFSRPGPWSVRLFVSVLSAIALVSAIVGFSVISALNLWGHLLLIGGWIILIQSIILAAQLGKSNRAKMPTRAAGSLA
jgi:serine/threonine protein kinase